MEDLIGEMSNEGLPEKEEEDSKLFVIPAKIGFPVFVISFSPRLEDREPRLGVFRTFRRCFGCSRTEMRRTEGGREREEKN